MTAQNQFHIRQVLTRRACARDGEFQPHGAVRWKKLSCAVKDNFGTGFGPTPVLAAWIGFEREKVPHIGVVAGTRFDTVGNWDLVSEGDGKNTGQDDQSRKKE